MVKLKLEGVVGMRCENHGTTRVAEGTGRFSGISVHILRLHCRFKDLASLLG